MKKMAVCWVILAVVVCVFSAHAKHQCSASKANRAEIEVPLARHWQALYGSYRHYHGCDDGAIAEGYSDGVARLLASHWEMMPRLVSLARQDPAFGDFVLRHLDETMTSVQAEAIKYNVTHQCPVDSRQLCRAISDRMDHLRL